MVEDVQSFESKMWEEGEEKEQSEDKEPELTLGIIEVDDAKKPSLSVFLEELGYLSIGIDTLCREEGNDLDSFSRGVKELTARYERITDLLGQSSPIKSAYKYKNEEIDIGPTGLYGIIRDYDPLLLRVSYVLRAATEYLEKRKEHESCPEAPKLMESCPNAKEIEKQAKAGRIIVRMFKKYSCYQAVWAGKKWTSGKLSQNLGVKAKRKAETSKAQMRINPIRKLSTENIKRLKKSLQDNAVKVFEIDPRALKKASILRSSRELAAEHEKLFEEYTSVGRRHQLMLETIVHWYVPPDSDPNTPGGRAFANLSRLKNEHDALGAELLSMEARLRYLADIYECDELCSQMGLLPDEIDLFASIVDLPFTIKHATPNWYCIANDGSLDSLAEFQKKNPNWKSEFSTPGNIGKLGNHGFAFFRVDVGYGPVTTRYGGTQIMDDMSVIETDGWISLFDQLKPLSSSTMQRYYDNEGALIRYAEMKGPNDFTHVYHYGNIPLKKKRNSGFHQAKSFSATEIKRAKSVEGERYEDMMREENFTNFVFYGPEIRAGIALSLIWEMRHFYRCGYRSYLMKCFKAVQKDTELCMIFLKKLIGQTFRPEGKYPVALRFTEHPVDEMLVLDPKGDRRWRLDGTEHPQVMPQVKVIQKRKFLIEATAQAKKTYYLHKKKVDEYDRALEEGLGSQKKQKTKSKSLSREETRKLRKEQEIKMLARKKEWDMYKEEKILVEKQYESIDSEFIIDEDDEMDEGKVKCGLDLEDLAGKVKVLRERSTVILPLSGTLIRSSTGQPRGVRYRHGRLFLVVLVQDDGNCFYRCCAEFLRDGRSHVDLRKLLSKSVLLGDSEQKAVARDKEYASIEHITAMAKELDVTVCVHKVSYASIGVVPVTVNRGTKGELHLLFLYNPIDGLGHINLLNPN